MGFPPRSCFSAPFAQNFEGGLPNRRPTATWPIYEPKWASPRPISGLRRRLSCAGQPNGAPSEPADQCPRWFLIRERFRDSPSGRGLPWRSSKPSALRICGPRSFRQSSWSNRFGATRGATRTSTGSSSHALSQKLFLKVWLGGLPCCGRGPGEDPPSTRSLSLLPSQMASCSRRIAKISVPSRPGQPGSSWTLFERRAGVRLPATRNMKRANRLVDGPQTVRDKLRVTLEI